MRISARNIALFGATALALANLGRIPVGALAGRNAPITLADIAVLLVWSALLVGILAGRIRIVADGVVKAAALFAAVATVSTVLALNRYGFSFEIIAFLARWIAYFGWYPFVAWCLTGDESRDAARYVENALLVICAFGIFQAIFLPEFATRLPQFGDAPEWEFQGRRLVSTLLDPNFAGGMAVLALISGLARVAEGIPQRAWALLIPAAAILLTASRSAVLALAAALGIIVLARGLRWSLVKTLGIGALLLLPLIPAVVAFGESMNKFSIDASAAQRLVTWKRAFTLFVEHPLLGIGFNATRQAQSAKGWIFIGGGDTGFDGGLLFIMVMTGVIGVLCYVLLLGRAMLAARRVWRDATVAAEDRAFAAATAASAVAIVVQSLFTNTLLLPFVMQVLWVRFGRLAHLSAQRRRHLGLAIALPLVAATACDPCFGVAGCGTEFRVRLQGSILHSQTGAPVAGTEVRVTFRGAEMLQVTVDTADALGHWEVQAPTSCCDRIRATAVVTAPGTPGYVVPDFEVRTLQAAGDVQLLGRWVHQPSIRYGIILVRNEVALVGARVTFQPTGGIPFTPVRIDEVSDINGIWRIDVTSDRMGEIIGTLTVTHPALPQPWRLAGLSVPVLNVFEFHRIISITLHDQTVLEPSMTSGTGSTR